MRVLHVIEAMHRGGAESLVVEHVRRAAPDVESFVCALNRGGPALEEARAHGAEVEVLRDPGGPAGVARLTGLIRLARQLGQRRIDVVNGHNPTGALYGTLAAALARFPVVVRTEHSIHYPGRHSVFYPPLERWMTGRAAAVICVCDAVRASHADRLPGLSDRFVTIANGIGAAPAVRPRAETRRALGIADEEPLILTVGSLTPQKSQHDLIDAMSEVRRALPAARLAIAGEGPRRDLLERRIGDRDLGRAVQLLGPRADVADLMSAADLFVLPSEREGLSITLLEAMRAGLPAVATAIGGNGEAVEAGVTGELVPPHDVAACATAIIRLLGDAGRRTAMGCAARARWGARFTADRMVAETEALYRKALGLRADAPAVAGAPR
jgi:glycosyltransferase involved in cell wall biosynthesis